MRGWQLQPTLCHSTNFKTAVACFLRVLCDQRAKTVFKCSLPHSSPNFAAMRVVRPPIKAKSPLQITQASASPLSYISELEYNWLGFDFQAMAPQYMQLGLARKRRYNHNLNSNSLPGWMHCGTAQHRAREGKSLQCWSKTFPRKAGARLFRSLRCWLFHNVSLQRSVSTKIEATEVFTKRHLHRFARGFEN